MTKFMAQKFDFENIILIFAILIMFFKCAVLDLKVHFRIIYIVPMFFNMSNISYIFDILGFCEFSRISSLIRPNYQLLNF